jgi:hypothetical protein
VGNAARDVGPDAARHGRRRTYQQGCTCGPCRAANAQYSAAYRAAQASGRPVLGARTAGQDALRLVARLLAEGYRRADIARGIGHQPDRAWPELTVGRHGAAVTWRTVYRLRVLLRRLDRWEA